MSSLGWLKTWVDVGCTVLGICVIASATAVEGGEITQTIIDESVLGPPSELQFEPFRETFDDGKRRTLTAVELSYEGEASMEVVIENFDTTPYDEGEWSYDFYHSVLFAFDSKEGYEDGGPFSFIGGLAIEGISGDLSAGDGGGFPFLQGTPGDVVVTDSTSGLLNASLMIEGWNDYFIGEETLNAKIGSFTEGLLTSPPLPNGSASINGRITDLEQTGTLELTYLYQVVGDFTLDDEVDSSDIDRLYELVQANDSAGDLNNDQVVDEADVDTLLSDILGSVYGDSNLDGAFDSSDLVAVFRAAEYEDSVARNSTWATGDWDGDGDFGSSDLVFVFQKATYTAAARPAAVPEPCAGLLALVGMGIAIANCRAWRQV